MPISDHLSLRFALGESDRHNRTKSGQIGEEPPKSIAKVKQRSSGSWRRFSVRSSIDARCVSRCIRRRCSRGRPEDHRNTSQRVHRVLLGGAMSGPRQWPFLDAGGPQRGADRWMPRLKKEGRVWASIVACSRERSVTRDSCEDLLRVFSCLQGHAENNQSDCLQKVHCLKMRWLKNRR
jgi:hypothetical protein